MAPKKQSAVASSSKKTKNLKDTRPYVQQERSGEEFAYLLARHQSAKRLGDRAVGNTWRIGWPKQFPTRTSNLLRTTCGRIKDDRPEVKKLWKDRRADAEAYIKRVGSAEQVCKDFEAGGMRDLVTAKAKPAKVKGGEGEDEEASTDEEDEPQQPASMVDKATQTGELDAEEPHSETGKEVFERMRELYNELSSSDEEDIEVE